MSLSDAARRYLRALHTNPPSSRPLLGLPDVVARNAFQNARAPLPGSPVPSGSPPSPSLGAGAYPQHDLRDWYEFLPVPRGCRAAVPEHLLITGGERWARCHAEGTPP